MGTEYFVNVYLWDGRACCADPTTTKQLMYRPPHHDPKRFMTPMCRLRVKRKLYTVEQNRPSVRRAIANEWLIRVR